MKLTEEQKKKVEANRGGAFSTYAYRLIWHEICDTLIAAGRRQARETACDVPTEVCEGEGGCSQTAFRIRRQN